MCPTGDGIKLVTPEEEKSKGLRGAFMYNTTVYLTVYPFVSDNYTNYVRALVSFYGGDLPSTYEEKLAEIRAKYPDW